MRKRRHNLTDGARTRIQRIRVSDEELARLRVLAEQQGVTVPRLLVESALADDRVSADELRQAAIEVRQARRLMGANARNLNQMTRWMHTHEKVHGDVQRTLAETRERYARMDAAIATLIDALERS